MSNIWILFYVFLMFVAGAVCTYTKSLKEHWSFWWVMIGTAILGSIAWVIASRRLTTTAETVWFSLVWDLLMIVAYYLIPLLFYEHRMNWQSWCAVGVIIAGIFWFKSQTEIIG